MLIVGGAGYPNRSKVHCTSTSRFRYLLWRAVTVQMLDRNRMTILRQYLTKHGTSVIKWLVQSLQISTEISPVMTMVSP